MCNIYINVCFFLVKEQVCITIFWHKTHFGLNVHPSQSCLIQNFPSDCPLPSHLTGSGIGLLFKLAQFENYLKIFYKNFKKTIGNTFYFQTA